MYNPKYDSGFRNARTCDVIPLNDASRRRSDVSAFNNQSGYVYGQTATNGRPTASRGANNVMTSYDVRQTNFQPQVFGGAANRTGERICQYGGDTQRPIDISENAKSAHGVTKTTSNQQLHSQRPWVPARGIRRSSLSGQGRGTSFEGMTPPGEAKLKRSETMNPTTEATPERPPQRRKALKRPSVVVTESTYLNLAVVVTVFFNIPIGLLAVLIAMRSASAYRGHRVQQGRRYATLALVVSLLGVVTTVAAVMAAVQYVTSKSDDVT